MLFIELTCGLLDDVCEDGRHDGVVLGVDEDHGHGDAVEVVDAAAAAVELLHALVALDFPEMITSLTRLQLHETVCFSL